MGDWNANVGSNVMKGLNRRPFGLGDKNQNGERLMNFATLNNLKGAGAYFKKINRRNGHGVPQIMLLKMKLNIS